MCTFCRCLTSPTFDPVNIALNCLDQCKATENILFSLKGVHKDIPPFRLLKPTIYGIMRW
jgi:hypothetical protein